MGYDLHISRGAGKSITVEEWLTFVRSEPDWTITAELSIVNPKTQEKITIGAPDDCPYAVWMAHPDVPQGVPFSWRNGRVTVKGPPVVSPWDPIFSKLQNIATRLNAQVVGDEGEVYHGGFRGTLQAISRLSRLARAFLAADSSRTNRRH